MRDPTSVFRVIAGEEGEVNNFISQAFVQKDLSGGFVGGRNDGWDGGSR